MYVCLPVSTWWCWFWILVCLILKCTIFFQCVMWVSLLTIQNQFPYLDITILWIIQEYVYKCSGKYKTLSACYCCYNHVAVVIIIRNLIYSNTSEIIGNPRQLDNSIINESRQGGLYHIYVRNNIFWFFLAMALFFKKIGSFPNKENKLTKSHLIQYLVS